MVTVKNYHDFDKFGAHSLLSLLEGCFVEYIGIACFTALTCNLRLAIQTRHICCSPRTTIEPINEVRTLRDAISTSWQAFLGTPVKEFKSPNTRPNSLACKRRFSTILFSTMQMRFACSHSLNAWGS